MAERLARLEGITQDFLTVRRRDLVAQPRENDDHVPSFLFRVIFDEVFEGKFAVKVWLANDYLDLLTWRSTWPHEAEIRHFAHPIDDWLDRMSRERQSHGWSSLVCVLYTSVLLVYRGLEMPDLLTRSEAKMLLRVLRVELPKRLRFPVRLGEEEQLG